MKVNLSSVDRVKRFVSVTGSFAFDIDLVSGRFTIDAKSIMGIFSLNLSRPLEVKAHCVDSVQMEAFEKALKDFEA